MEKGDISTTVVGTGNLTGQSAEDVMIPTGVKVESVLAESGDHVKKGDVLAMLDAASVKQAMLEVQEEIETLDEEIEEARDDTASASVSAGVSGTVKTIAYGHFPRPAGPHFPDSLGHIKRTAQ